MGLNRADERSVLIEVELKCNRNRSSVNGVGGFYGSVPNVSSYPNFLTGEYLGDNLASDLAGCYEWVDRPAWGRVEICSVLQCNGPMRPIGGQEGGKRPRSNSGKRFRGPVPEYWV